MASAWSEKTRAARVKENESLGDMLAPGMALAPDKVAVYFEDRAITFREFDEAVNRVANGLIAAGVKPLDRVAIHVDNRPEFIMIHLGVMRVGATLVPTNIMYTADEMQHILTDSGAKLLFIVGAVSDKLDAVDAPMLETVIELGEAKRTGSVSLADFMAKAGTTRPEVKPDPAACAAIQYTSGTTGVPKGAMVSHNNVLAVINNTEDLPGSPEAMEDDVSLLVLPLFHSYGLNLVITRTFLSVQTMILMNRFDANQVFANFEKYKVTVFAGAPPMYFAFVNTPGLDKYDVSSLRMAGSGAAPLPVVIMEKFKELTGVQISEGYGLSETAPTLSSNACGQVVKPGTVGPAIREVEMKIFDESDNEVARGEVGEVVAKGPNIFMGYWNLPEATAEAMRGGWFHTGDMGRFDEDGYLTIVDRKKDMVVVSGYNVYPIEIESVILRHPKVIDCAVIGVPDGYQGESVKACVVLGPDQSLEEGELDAHCREHLAAYKVPKHYVERDALPKNLTGKVLKRVLRDEEGGVTKARV